MLSTADTHSLRKKPTLLDKYGPSHPDWNEALSVVACSETSRVGGALENRYHRLAPADRANAARILVDSPYANEFRRPDPAYLQAWLGNVLAKYQLQFKDDSSLSEVFVWARPNIPTLSRWLNANPKLYPHFLSSLTTAFKSSGASENTPEQKQFIVDGILAKKLRVPAFYAILISHIPSLLPLAEKYISEDDCLAQMSASHCEYAAELPGQWGSVFPQSNRIKDIGVLLDTMQMLGAYDGVMLRTGLGLTPVPEIDLLSLPDDAYAAFEM